MTLEMSMDFRRCWVEWLGGGKKLLLAVRRGTTGMVLIVALAYDMASEVLSRGPRSYR